MYLSRFRFSDEREEDASVLTRGRWIPGVVRVFADRGARLLPHFRLEPI